jgi:hypothetical protein
MGARCLKQILVLVTMLLLALSAYLWSAMMGRSRTNGIFIFFLSVHFQVILFKTYPYNPWFLAIGDFWDIFFKNPALL